MPGFPKTHLVLERLMGRSDQIGQVVRAET